MPNRGPWARDLICVSLRVPGLRAPKGFFLPWSFLWFCSPAVVCNFLTVVMFSRLLWHHTNHLYAHIQPNVFSLPWRPRTNYMYRSVVQIWCWLSFLQGLSPPLHLPGSGLPVATSPSSRNSAQVLPCSNEAVQMSVVASFLQASPFMNPINLLAFCCTSAACWFLLKCSFPPFLLTQHQCPPIGTDTRTVPNYHANNFLGEPHIHVSKLWLLWKRIQPFHVTCPSHIHPNAFILMRIFSLYCPWVFACIVSVSEQVNFRTDNFLP